MHVLVIEPLPRQHQQMPETLAELTSAWLSNQPGLDPCRRCHQTAFKGSAPTVCWRRSRKGPEGNVRHMFDWSRPWDRRAHCAGAFVIVTPILKATKAKAQ